MAKLGIFITHKGRLFIHLVAPKVSLNKAKEDKSKNAVTKKHSRRCPRILIKWETL